MILRNNLITNLGYGWKDVRHWLRFLLKQKRWCFQLTAWSLTNGRLSQSELRAAWLLWASQFSAGPAGSLILMHNLITGSRGIQGTNNDIILIDRVIRLQCVYRVRDGRRASHNLTISFNSNNIISAWSKLWWISIWSYDMPILPGMEIFIIKLDRKRINILTTLIPRSAKNRKFKYKNCRIHTEDKDENTQLTGSHGNMPNRR